jgi:hypothetical protein
MKGEPFKKIAAVLKNVAPTLLTASTGGLAPLALNIAKSVLGNTGMDDNSLLDTISAATGSSEGLTKLREIEAALQQAELENNFKFEELATKNTIDARAMAVKTGLGTQKLIACWYLGGYFGTLATMIYFGAQGLSFDTGMLELIKQLMTAFSIGVPIILQFFFGSSAGSKAKDAALGASQ